MVGIINGNVVNRPTWLIDKVSVVPLSIDHIPLYSLIPILMVMTDSLVPLAKREFIRGVARGGIYGVNIAHLR